LIDPDIAILVVDDSSSARRIVRYYLKNMGYGACFEAENGRDALKVLENEKIDLIISDLAMPIMDGMDLLVTVRQHSVYGAIPFIILTANNEQDTLVKAVAAKVNHYIIKPFTAETLEEKVRAVLP